MFKKVIFTTAVCAMALGLVAPALAQCDYYQGILPPGSVVEGKTYGEWAVAWWQWAMGTPAGVNPVLDPTGEYCNEGQDLDARVWFHPATFGFSVERSCTVPRGRYPKMIFMPVYMWIFGEAAFDCGRTNPGVQCDVEILRATAEENVSAARALVVTIDGVPVWDVFAYRAAYPDPFAIAYRANNIYAEYGVKAGHYSPNMTDGFWLMLEPLPSGQHTIHCHVCAPNTPYAGTIQFTVVTHLTVE